MRWYVTTALIMSLLLVLSTVIAIGHLTSWRYRGRERLDALFDEQAQAQQEEDEDGLHVVSHADRADVAAQTEIEDEAVGTPQNRGDSVTPQADRPKDAPASTSTEHGTTPFGTPADIDASATSSTPPSGWQCDDWGCQLLNANRLSAC